MGYHPSHPNLAKWDKVRYNEYRAGRRKEPPPNPKGINTMEFDIVATGTGDEMHRHGCRHSQRKGVEVVFTSDDPVALAEYCWDPTIMQEDADETNRSYEASCRGLLWDIVAPCAADHL